MENIYIENYDYSYYMIDRMEPDLEYTLYRTVNSTWETFGHDLYEEMKNPVGDRKISIKILINGKWTQV